MRRTVLICLVLLLGSVAAYWPLRYCGFVNFDDPLYVTNNPHVFHGLNLEGIRWAFTTMHAANWHPLTWLSHMLDCQLFGDNPPAHHFVNLFFHAAATLLLFWTLKRMTKCEFRSAFVAALFAWHPLHVESVAWIAERKDVLSAFFFMLTIGAYVNYAESQVWSLKSKVAERGRSEKSEGRGPKAEGSPNARNPKEFAPGTRHPALWYGLALGLFALGLMSKPMLVTLPFVLLLLDFWPLGRYKPLQHFDFLTFQRLLAEKLPFFILAAASSVVTFLAQSKGGAVVSEDMIPFRLRILNAVVAYGTYLAEMVWPRNLAVFYPHPLVWPAWIVVGSLFLLVAISILVTRAARQRPYLIVGWLWYLGTLAPVIGLVQVGSQAKADRYAYLPLVGVFIMMVWGLTDLVSHWRRSNAVLAVAGGLAVGACVLCANQQVSYWRDSLTLFRHALEVAPESPLSQRNLGQALSEWGRQEEAIVHFQKALELKPDFALAHVNLGNSLNVLGRLDEAMPHYREAIELHPGYEMAHYQLANALALKGRLPEAESHFQAALQHKPDYAEAHTKLGNLLTLEHRSEEAMPHYYAAIKCNPDYEEGYYYLGAALARQNNFEDAVAYLRQAIKLNPDDALALNDLAWILATADRQNLRNPTEAIQLARRACELTHPANPKYLDTLAVAFSEARRFAEAIATTRRAVSAAESAGQNRLAAAIQSRLEFYQQGHTYREISNSASPAKP